MFGVTKSTPPDRGLGYLPLTEYPSNKPGKAGASANHATNRRSQSGSGADFFVAESAHTVLAPPSAQSTPGSSVRSSVM